MHAFDVVLLESTLYFFQERLIVDHELIICIEKIVKFEDTYY